MAFASRVCARALSILSPLSLRACMRTESCNLFLLCSAAVLSRFIYPPSDPSSEQRGVTFNQHLGPRLAGNGLQTKWRKQHSSYFTLDLLLHSLHLIPCNILPAINHVDECSLLCVQKKKESESKERVKKPALKRIQQIFQDFKESFLFDSLTCLLSLSFSRRKPEKRKERRGREQLPTPRCVGTAQAGQSITTRTTHTQAPHTRARANQARRADKALK